MNLVGNMLDSRCLGDIDEVVGNTDLNLGN